MSTYSMWMLEYSHSTAQPMGCIFYGQWNAGTRMFAYSYVYLEGNGHKILVDIGHDNQTSNLAFNDLNGISDYQYPDAVLAKIGVAPSDIDTIILTHAHYDHAGAVRWFPSATFYMQRRELETSREVLSQSPLFDSLIKALDPDDIDVLGELHSSGRLVLLDGPVPDFLPQLAIHTAWDTHTMGGQYVVMTDDEGLSWVITGDGMYSYENAEGIDQSGEYVAIGFGGGSGWAGIRLIDEMTKIAVDTSRLVIVHESATFERHPAHTYDDNLSVAELTLAPGTATRLPSTN